MMSVPFHCWARARGRGTALGRYNSRAFPFPGVDGAVLEGTLVSSAGSRPFLFSPCPGRQLQARNAPAVLRTQLAPHQRRTGEGAIAGPILYHSDEAPGEDPCGI